MTESEHKPCPFCGGKVDPTGWMSWDSASDPDSMKQGPECEGCGATAPSMEVWNRRAHAKPVAWRFRLREGGPWSYCSNEMKHESYYFVIEPLVVQKNV